MDGKELKKLSRRELVDVIYQMKKNEQKMQEEIVSLQEALQEKRIRLSEAGSISEAAAAITNVFSAAQMTADLYLQEISCMKEDAEKERARIVEEAKELAERLLLESKKRCEEFRACYQAEYQKWQQLQAEIQALEERKKHEA